MRIVVVGVGGLGGLYGGMLARHGDDLTFIARGPSLEALRARGLTVSSPSLGNFTVPVRATDEPEALDPPDLVLFCVKAYDLVEAAEQIRPQTVGVGRARQVAIPADCVDRIMAMADSLPPGARPSLLEDLADGRRLELDSINGAIIEAGREVSVPTPMNAVIYAALKPYADGAPTLP